MDIAERIIRPTPFSYCWDGLFIPSISSDIGVATPRLHLGDDFYIASDTASGAFGIAPFATPVPARTTGWGIRIFEGTGTTLQSAGIFPGTSQPFLGMPDRRIRGLAYTRLVYEVIVRTGATLPNSATVIGIHRAWNYTAEPNHSVYFFRATGTNWLARTRGTATTSTDTGIAISTSTSYTLKIVVASGSVEFYINDVLRATHTTNLPAAESFFHPRVLITDNTTANTNMDLLYWRWEAV